MPVDSEPTPRQYLQHQAELAWRWSRRQVLATASWARRQPRARLVTLAVATVGALLGAWLALELLLWILSVLSGGHAVPHAPPRVHHHAAPPQWATALNHVGLWRQIAESVQVFAAQHSAASGTPAWLLLTLWCGFGGCLLLGGWIARKRWGICTLAFIAWTVATAWVIWTHTPGADPVPAALAAALGITAAVVPLAAPLLLMVVVLGVVPPIT